MLLSRKYGRGVPEFGSKQSLNTAHVGWCLSAKGTLKITNYKAVNLRCPHSRTLLRMINYCDLCLLCSFH